MAVHLLRQGAGATIELDRPETLNAWDRALGEELLAAVRSVAADESVRAVTLRGAGRGFSSGADLKAGFERTPTGELDVRTVLQERYQPIITAIRTMPKPVLAAVHGPAAGIGCALALACDLVLAAQSAYFMLAFTRIGLVPDGGSALLVPARVGFARFAEMALLGERIDAERALSWGLINRVVPDERFEAEVAELAQRLAAGPTLAYAGIKRQLNAWLMGELQRTLELEAELQQQLVGSADFGEGVAAFEAKRPARFAGR